MTSYNNTKWEIGVTITITKKGNRMCTDQVLHCYNHPLLAVILNPLHVKIQNPRLFEIEVDEIVNSDSLKFASKSQTLIKEIDVPKISLEQRFEFGIRVTKLVYKDKKWNLWADKWLSGEDRSRGSADAAADGAAYAYTYARAADVAARAAYVAARAAYVADVARAAARAADVAHAAAYAARSVNTKEEFNEKMIDVIEKIVKVEA